jgi:uncharacterized membrane protein YcaP (DUF421 family)
MHAYMRTLWEALLQETRVNHKYYSFIVLSFTNCLGSVVKRNMSKLQVLEFIALPLAYNLGSIAKIFMNELHVLHFMVLPYAQIWTTLHVLHFMVLPFAQIWMRLGWATLLIP